MLRLGLEKLNVRRRLRAECLCGGLPFPMGFRVGVSVVPALADTSTAQLENEDKFSQIDCLIDDKRHSGFGFGNAATVCCKTDGRIGNAASKLASLVRRFINSATYSQPPHPDRPADESAGCGPPSPAR
jgi:hypothetical protein